VSAASYVVLMTAQRALVLWGGFGATTAAAPDVVGTNLVGASAATVAILVAYAAIIAVCHRGGLSRAAQTVVLAAPFVIELGLLAISPSESTDVLAYAAQGGLGLIVPGATPYSDPARLLGSALGDALEALGWRAPPIPSPYGPLWAGIEQIIARLPMDLAGQVAAFRLVEMAAVAVSGLLVWKILERVRPGMELLGTVLFLWNPVVIRELPGEGHNDGMMVMFVLLGLWATLRGRAGLSVVATAAAVLVKYLPLSLFPAQAVYLWRTVPDRRRLVLEMALGAGIAGAITIGLIAPIWAPDMFDGLRSAGSPRPWPTLGGGVVALMARFQVDATAAVSAISGLGFAALVLWVSARVREPDSLLRGAVAIAGVYMLAVSPVFFPWYVALPIALCCLLPERSMIFLVFALTIASRVIALIDYDRFPEAWIVATFTGVVVGLLSLLVVLTPAGPVAGRLAKRLHEARVARL